MAVIGAEVPRPLLSEVSDLGERRAAEAVEVLARAAVSHPRRDERRPRVRVQAPADPGGRVRLPALGAPSARAPQRSRRRSSASTPTGSTSAPPCSPTTARPPASGSRQPAGTLAPRPGQRSPSPADGMRHWRRVRDLASELEAFPERDELAAKARLGILSLAWRLGISPDEAAAIRAEAHADAERSPRGLWYAGWLLHSGREREGLDTFRRGRPSGGAAGDPALALTASTGVAYASWVAGSLREGVDDARPRRSAGGRRPDDRRRRGLRLPARSCLWPVAACARGTWVSSSGRTRISTARSNWRASTRTPRRSPPLVRTAR